MKNIKVFNSFYKRFYTSTTSRKPYDPNVVNQCVNPKPGRLMKSTPLLVALAGFLLVTPLVSTYYDNERFKVEMERRNTTPGIRY